MSSPRSSPRSQPLHAGQYSVTHYERMLNALKPHLGVLGIVFKFDIELICLTLISGPLNLLNSSSGPSPFLPFSVLSSASSRRPHLWFHSCVGVISGIFACTSWGLCATGRMISVVAGPDDTDSITPPDSARSGGLHSKWTGGALCTCPSTASLHPGGWIDEGSGDVGSAHSGISSYASSPAGSLMPPYSPASALLPLSHRRSPGGFPGTPAGLGLSLGFLLPTSASAACALRSPATAAMLGSTDLDLTHLRLDISRLRQGTWGRRMTRWEFVS
jgi:hypothetical protein